MANRIVRVFEGFDGSVHVETRFPAAFDQGMRFIDGKRWYGPPPALRKLLASWEDMGGEEQDELKLVVQDFLARKANFADLRAAVKNY
jgi:hypothetical protein